MSQPSSAPTVESWMPPEFAASTARRSLADFRNEFSEYYFLLVQLTDPSGPLAVALQRASTLSEPNATSSDDIGYTTVLCTSTELNASALPDAGDTDTIAPEITRTPRFIVPVRARKWQEADPRDRIWVGRAHNNDIVLRHRTVSKCHACFSYDEDRRLFVKDARSRNETRVNGTPVDQQPLELKAGDHIAFGSVQAELCSADALWQTLSR